MITIAINIATDYCSVFDVINKSEALCRAPGITPMAETKSQPWKQKHIHGEGSATIHD